MDENSSERIFAGCFAVNSLCVSSPAETVYPPVDEAERSIARLIKRLIKVGERVSYQVAGRVFMWPQHSPWLDINALCSGEIRHNVG